MVGHPCYLRAVLLTLARLSYICAFTTCMPGLRSAIEPPIAKATMLKLLGLIAAVVLALVLYSRSKSAVIDDAATAVQITPEINLDPPKGEAGDPLPSSDDARHTLLSARRLPNGHALALSRRIQAGTGLTYFLREYDCARGRFQLREQGVGASETRDSNFGDVWNESYPESVTYHTGAAACLKIGRELQTGGEHSIL